jgi:hypothetical protein
MTYFFRNATAVALILCGMALLASPAHAVLITNTSTTLYNTGVDASEVSLTHDAIDGHYALVTVPSGSTVPLATTSAGGFPIGPWIGDSAASAWIGPGNDDDRNGDVGLYVYQQGFVLPSDGTLTITGRVSHDNSLPGILVNGNLVFGPNDGPEFTDWTPFSFSVAGLSGANTIDFQVFNFGGPTSLRVEFTEASFTSAVPEPSSLILLGMGGMGMGLAAWRRRRAVTI